MKFLLDESVEYRLSSYLTTLGHNVTAIAHDSPASIEDQTVLTVATHEKRILITNDRDFGELIFRQQLHHSGVIFLRMRGQTVEDKQTRLGQVIAEYADQLHHFLVVTPKRVRVRRNLEQKAA
jgi:predicted nuclease of predicted toxin-antitoxin system